MELDDIPGMSESNSMKRNVAVGLVYFIAFSAIVGSFAEDPDSTADNGVETNGNVDDMEDADNSVDDEEQEDTEPESYSEQFGVPTPDDADRELAQEAALRGYANADDMYKGGIREVDFIPQTDGGYLIEIRYDLSVPEFGGLANNAESGGGQITKSIVQSVSQSDAENVVEVYTYGYVPTQSGDDTVAHSVGVEDIDMFDETRPWQDLRDASNYRFNEYLFN